MLNNVQKSNSRGPIHMNQNFDKNQYLVTTLPRIIQHSTWRESFIFNNRLDVVACRDRVVVILRDCGSLEPGSNPGPGLKKIIFSHVSRTCPARRPCIPLSSRPALWWLLRAHSHLRGLQQETSQPRSPHRLSPYAMRP